MGTDYADYQAIVAGGGPAGMMTGFLLARAGVRTLVLEKHADFFRDFRGDTVHPSTMEILAQLGLLDTFLSRKPNRLRRAQAIFDGREVNIADFSRLDTVAPFIAMMPQWDFLDFMRDEASKLPGFALRLEAEVTEFVEANRRIGAVRLASGETFAASGLVIAADGRGSLVRTQSLLPFEDLGAPIDVLWFAVPKTISGDALRFYVHGHALIAMIDRGDFWQCAFVVAKGSAETVKARGIAAFREAVRAAAPELPDLAQALPDWDKVKLLSVSLDRLTTWHRPGLLAIGDAAHAMSPVGGVGINLAIQDAVATANLLAAPLAADAPVDALLARVQRRRMLPTRVIQGAQRIAHRFVLAPMIGGGSDAPIKPPFMMELFDRCPPLRRFPAQLIGLGVRRERVASPKAV